MIHTQRSLAANYSSLHVGNSVSKSLKMDLRSLMKLLPPKKKLTHARCFTPNMLPLTIYINVCCGRRQRCVYHLPFSIPSDKWHVYPMCEKKTDYDTLTLAKLGSLMLKRLVKLYKDFMHSPAATTSTHKVVGENQCSKAGYEGGRLKKAMVGVGKAWIKGEVGTLKVVKALQ